MVTVSNLEQALLKDGITLIAGQEGLGRMIDYLTVQEFSFKSSRIHKNGFIMTTFYGFKNIDEIIQHFEWYVKTEVSGVGFHTVIHREIPQKLIDFANETKIPLFVIPCEIPYHFIYEKYNNLIYQETSKLKNSIEKLNQSILDALVLEKDIHFIIQSIGKYLRVPIIYLNKDMDILSLWTPGPVSRFDLRSWLEGLIANYHELFETVRRTNKFITERHLHKINQSNSVVIIPLSNNLSFYGYLLIVNQEEPVAFQDIILKNTVTALILDAIKKNQTIEFQKNKDIRLLEDIFLNKRKDALNTDDFYYEINRLHSIVIAKPADSSLLKQSYQLLKKHIEKTDKNALVWLMDRTVIALLQVEFTYNLPEEINLKVGISGKKKEVTNESIQILYEQAKVALHFSYIQEKPYCEWTGLGMEQINYYIRESPLLKEFYVDYLQDLINYDEGNKTELVKTLYVYLNTFFSLKESGDKLHLHPNTVKYRIKKIQEIMDIQFNDPNQYLNLMISLKSYLYDLECRELES
ncbi:helix-turn-helix domain-containing protein [Neobacillus drentensis]|uniref:helix-turn-helix domain-containing protein n=1 Tax=Neobacillus drentensis TaxID=220684 RepID=UPI002FFEBF35